jgi:hypothetical protein
MAALADILKTAWDERIRLNRWFRMNASANRSVPWQEDTPIEVHVVHSGDTPQKPTVVPATNTTAPTPTPATTPVPVPTPTPVPVPTPVPNPQKQPTLIGAAVKYGLIALGLSGSGGAGYLLNQYFTRPQQESAGSLFQYLQDNLYHVPEAGNGQ